MFSKTSVPKNESGSTKSWFLAVSRFIASWLEENDLFDFCICPQHKSGVRFAQLV